MIRSKALLWTVECIRNNGFHKARLSYPLMRKELGNDACSKLTFMNDYLVKAKKIIREDYPKEYDRLIKNKVVDLVRDDDTEDLPYRFPGKDANVLINRDKTVEDQPLVNIETDNSAGTETITTMSLNIRTQEDLLKYAEIDLDVWEVDRCNVGVSNVTISAKKSSTGKDTTYTNYALKLMLKRRKDESLTSIKDEFIKDLEELSSGIEFSTPYMVMNKTKTAEPVMVEISVPDFHFGQRSWDEETYGENWSVNIASNLLELIINKLIETVCSTYGNIDRILFPIGNDFFNVDSPSNTTTKGTPQDEDENYKKTFTIARRLLIKLIDQLNEVSPVEIVIIPGNHDEERSFFMGEVLDAWYNNNEYVNINNRPSSKKYHLYGNTLLGFMHQYKANQIKDLPFEMATDVKDWFAKAKFYEWHVGHTHAEKVISIRDCKIITLPSLAPESNWSSKSGFKHLREGQAQVYSLDKGKLATFSAPAEQFTDILKDLK